MVFVCGLCAYMKAKQRIASLTTKRKLLTNARHWYTWYRTTTHPQLHAQRHTHTHINIQKISKCSCRQSANRMTGWLYGIFHVHALALANTLIDSGSTVKIFGLWWFWQKLFFRSCSSPCRSLWRVCVCLFFVSEYVINEYHYYLLCGNLYAIYSILPKQNNNNNNKYERSTKRTMFTVRELRRRDCVCLVNIVWYSRFTKHFTVFYLRLLVKRYVILYAYSHEPHCACVSVCVCYVLKGTKATVVLIKHERAENSIESWRDFPWIAHTLAHTLWRLSIRYHQINFKFAYQITWLSLKQKQAHDEIDDAPHDWILYWIYVTPQELKIYTRFGTCLPCRMRAHFPHSHAWMFGIWCFFSIIIWLNIADPMARHHGKY